MYRPSSGGFTLEKFFEATHGDVVEVQRTDTERIGGGAYSDVWRGSMRSGQELRAVAVKRVRWDVGQGYDTDRSRRTLKVRNPLFTP